MQIRALLHSKTLNCPGAPNIIEPDGDDPVTIRSPNCTAASNIIEPDNDNQVASRYNLRSQAHYVLDATTPLLVEKFNSVLENVSGNLLEYRHLIKGPNIAIWTRSLANDFGRLAQGVETRMPKGTNIIFFIPRHQVLKNRKISYIKPVVTIQPNKVEVNRV